MTAVQDSGLFERVLNGVADGVLVVDGTGTIVHASERALSMFGYEQDELVGQPAELLVPERARDVHRRLREDYVGVAHAREMGSGLPLEGRHRDGSTFPVDIRLEPLRSGGLVVVSVRERPSGEDAAELAGLRRREMMLRTVLDTVTQHLFAIGMSLGSMERHALDPAFAARLDASSELLDRTIELTRSAQHFADPGP